MIEKLPQNQRRGGFVDAPILPSNIPQYNNRILRAIGTGAMRLLGWRFVGSVPNLSKFVAIGAPHTSGWDVVVAVAAFWALQIELKFMAKHTLTQGLFGRWFKTLGAIGIERSHPSGVVGQLVEQFEQREHLVLALAPEGTRSKVERWKTGFYHIAVHAGVPIFTVGIDFGRKEIRFGDLFHPTGDLEADIAILQTFFADITAKHPDKA